MLHKHGLPDAGLKLLKHCSLDHVSCRVVIRGFSWNAVVWNPWDKPGRNASNLGDDYKTMVSVDSAVFEKPIVLKPFQVWRGFQEINAVSSSYCSGQLDPTKVVQDTT